MSENCNPNLEGKDDRESLSTTTKVVTKKPIVLSSTRYDKLMYNATHAEKMRALKDAEEEQKYREYLKEGSDKIVATFKGNITRTQEDKLEELKTQTKAKLELIKKSYDQSREREERKRREKITKAQDLIDRLKPGARELHSAAMQSEVLRARNVQRNINEEFERAVRRQQCLDKANCEKISKPWVEDEHVRDSEHQNYINTYKKELLQTINENSKNRADYKKQLLKEQQAERESMDQEIKAQIEKEKAIMEKKRAALRKNALEAMKMVEQRRLRERMTEEIEDRLCCVYNVGKLQLDTLKAEQAKLIAADRVKAVETNSRATHKIKRETIDTQEDLYKRDISHMQLKFTAEEQEKVRKDKAAKQARIEAYMRELEQQKEVKRRLEEQKRFEVAQRFKNMEVNAIFNEAEKKSQHQKVQQLREQLDAQNAEQQRVKLEELKKIPERDCQTINHERDDKMFFEHARNLMEDAQKKERPLYPIVKVVQQYKRRNNIDCEVKTPKHLVSNVQIGVRQPGDSKADAEQAKKQQEQSDAKAEKTNKESILENCLKINEIIAASAAAAEKCTTICGFDCAQPGETDRVIRSKLAKECATKSMLADQAKVRYTASELKNMNRFMAHCA